MIPADVRNTCLQLIDFSTLMSSEEDARTHREIIQEILESAASPDDISSTIVTVFAEIHPAETIELITSIVQDALNKAIQRHSQPRVESHMNKELLLSRMKDFIKPGPKPATSVPPSVDDSPFSRSPHTSQGTSQNLQNKEPRKPITIVKADGQIINPPSTVYSSNYPPPPPPPPFSSNQTGRDRNREYASTATQNSRNHYDTTPLGFSTSANPSNNVDLLLLLQQQAQQVQQQQSQQQTQQQQVLLQALLAAASATPSTAQNVQPTEPIEPETIILQPNHKGLTWNLHIRSIPTTCRMTPLVNFFNQFGNVVAVKLFPYDPSRIINQSHQSHGSQREPFQTAMVHFSTESSASACLFSGQHINNNPSIKMTQAHVYPSPYHPPTQHQPSQQTQPQHGHLNRQQQQQQQHQSQQQQPQLPPRPKNPHSARLYALKEKERKLREPLSDELFNSNQLSLQNTLTSISSLSKLRLKVMQELISKKKAFKLTPTDESIQKDVVNVEKQLKACNDQVSNLEKQRDQFLKEINEEKKNREIRDWCKTERAEVNRLMAEWKESLKSLDLNASNTNDAITAPSDAVDAAIDGEIDIDQSNQISEETPLDDLPIVGDETPVE